jgi:5-formyltetrahydrofolate cyclo-ligase
MQTTSDIDEAKRALRMEAEIRRHEAATTDDGRAGARLAERFLDSVTVPAGAVVSGFWPIRTEIDVIPLLHALAARGHTLALPVVVGPARPLVFRAWREGDAMAEGPYGIREPLADVPEVAPHVLLVPLLAFDRAGWRLGYGGGFYDRSLAALRERSATMAIGVAWAAQEVAAVPRDGRDQPLDWVVTEREALRIAGDAA